MKNLLLLVCATLIFTASSFSQKYFTKNGKVNFDATAPSSPEKIEGINRSVTCVVDAKTGNMQFAVLMKGFEFERALMEEHFNENYMESTKFPKASFKGKITGMPVINTSSNGSFNVQTEGELTIHGVTQKITAPAKLTVNGGKITGVSSFKIVLSDYKIVIPGVVAEKFSKETEITVTCIYEPRS